MAGKEAGKMPADTLAPGGAAELSDLELVDRVVRGARGAFDQFYHRHHRLIYHCIRVRAESADVNDLFQAFFERLIEREYHILKMWQRGTSLPIYLSKVVRNFVIDFHRSKRKREQSVGGLAELEPLTSGQDETMTTGIMLKELRRKGLEAWAMLEKRDQILVCGKFHRELSNEDLAKRLALSVGALRTALSRAQARLLQSLRSLVPEYFPTEA
jgi:RNA polymerase sigma factor (sigma-70 family)